MKSLLMRNLLIASFTLGHANLLASAPSIDTIYTNLSSKSCKTIEVDQETGYFVRRCAGVANYSLLVSESDARQSVTVITPNGKQHPLNYPSVITAAFSTVGKKAEWRVERKGGKILPIALIVRVNANENLDLPYEETSYLAVAKITPEKICVTQKLKGGVPANEKARRAADASSNKPCLK